MTHVVQHEPEPSKKKCFSLAMCFHGGYLRQWRHHGQDHGREARQQHRRTDRAKPVINLPREQRKRRGEDCAHRRIARERGSRD
jgi:hypothetical protein